MARRRTVQRDPLGRIASTYEEENEENEDALLKDGETFRVPLYMRDGAINPDLTQSQRAKAGAHQQYQDAAARKFGLTDGLQLHRPGFRYNTDAAAQERTRQAYNDYDAADANACEGQGIASSRYLVPRRRPGYQSAPGRCHRRQSRGLSAL